MHILIIGANGGIGRLLVPRLVDAGHGVRAMVRDGSQAPALRELGAEPVVADLEGDFRHVLDGCEAVVFTAGSGGHTGADRTAAVDGLGAIRAVNEARARGVGRFVMVSARGADDPDRSPAIRHYLVAKAIADGYLRDSGLDYTILRPGRLTDDPPTSRIRIGEALGSGQITRADVAAAIVAALDLDVTIGKTFELLNDGAPIRDALAGLRDSGRVEDGGL
jgi:uncharacterized protein YbjT (DUF2867 family)